jgi:hypothetical protein
MKLKGNFYIFQMNEINNLLCKLSRYESLKRQGLILYGADLEKAVAIKKAMESKNVERARQESLKRQELGRFIALRKAEVADLASQHKMMRFVFKLSL